ncbi:MAG: glycosyltransferase family 4 protein [Gammaproteobacteria bacterium]
MSPKRSVARGLTKVLIISHGHPALSLGGAEVASHNLFVGLNELPGIEAHYLARVNEKVRRHGSSSLLSLRQGDREVLYHATSYDDFHLSNQDTGSLQHDFLRHIKDLGPDVVHFHHFIGLGLECLFAVKRLLPSVPIVVTFHEYMAVCHHHGQMVKRGTHQLCRRASPSECTVCFPEIGENAFYRREVFARTLLGLADRYVAPSRFLRQRYVEWGLPNERFSVIENGLRDTEVAPERALGRSGRRNRFAYFGQLNPFKGIEILVDAVQRVADETWARDGQLNIFGGGLEYQTEDFQRKFVELLERAGARVRHHGRYDNAEVGRLMGTVDWVVVPSTWWENSPVVIQEAFHHRRPVIASNIGGMAEKVRDGKDGLHFQVGSADDLADRLSDAIMQPDLWGRLRSGIEQPLSASACAQQHLDVYAAAAANALQSNDMVTVTVGAAKTARTTASASRQKTGTRRTARGGINAKEVDTVSTEPRASGKASAGSAKPRRKRLSESPANELATVGAPIIERGP